MVPLHNNCSLLSYQNTKKIRSGFIIRKQKILPVELTGSLEPITIKSVLRYVKN